MYSYITGNGRKHGIVFFQPFTRLLLLPKDSGFPSITNERVLFMKKQFKNIFKKSKKKNKFRILLCVISVTLILGMITGCSIMESNLKEKQIDTPQEESDDSTNTQIVTIATEELEKSLQNNVQNSELTLSADAQEIESIAKEFTAAYFGGDIYTIQKYLTVPYEWDIDIYTGTGVISEVNVKGLTDIGEEEIGNIKIISLEYRDSNIEETFLYLTVEFIKQEDGWKIQFYGVER